MKKIYFIVFVALFPALFLSELQAQVGIGTENPSNTLHVKPLDPDEDPLKIENLNEVMQGDSALLVVDPATGVVRYLHINQLISLVPANPDPDPTNEWQNAVQVPIEPSADLDNNGIVEENVQEAIFTLANKLPKGTFRTISDARDSGLEDGDSFWADPEGIFGCSGCVITLHPGME